eukprot:364626-Chlamydomonas_euryale.AAC.7
MHKHTITQKRGLPACQRINAACQRSAHTRLARADPSTLQAPRPPRAVSLHLHLARSERAGGSGTSSGGGAASGRGGGSGGGLPASGRRSPLHRAILAVRCAAGGVSQRRAAVRVGAVLPVLLATRAGRSALRGEWEQQAAASGKGTCRTSREMGSREEKGRVRVSARSGPGDGSAG